MGNLSSHSKCKSEDKVETQKILTIVNGYGNYSPTQSIYGPEAIVNHTKKNTREHRGQYTT